MQKKNEICEEKKGDEEWKEIDNPVIGEGKPQ